jgi:agmatinase
MVRYEPRELFREPAVLRVRTFARLPNVQDLKNAGAAVVGAPFCVGARFGPEGIRSVSHQT